MHIIIDDKIFKVERKPAFDLKGFLKSIEPVVSSIEFDKIHPNIKLGLFAWGALGFYRGSKYHSMLYQKELDKHNKLLERGIVTRKRPEQYYVGKFAYGLFTSFMYFVPGVNLFYIAKEIWRLEIFLRGLDEDTESEQYNHLCN
jgi:hypothetical protein